MHVRFEELLDASEREILSNISQEVNVAASTWSDTLYIELLDHQGR
jgi:hypothetical protein